MHNKSIGILECYFTLAGEKKWSEARKVLEKAEECLRRAGVEKIISNEEQNTLNFKIRAGKNTDALAKYELDILPGEHRMRLKQILFQSNERSAISSMKWYIKRRNENIPRGMKYYLSPVRLECSISMADEWENELLRRVIDMMCITGDDYEFLRYLNEGVVPEEIQRTIRQEYKQYEGEIANGISIRKNDSGFKRTGL